MASALAGATETRAHWVQPEEVISRLRDTAVRQTFDVREVGRHPDLPRLLVIRVGPGWSRLGAPKRQATAEDWRRLWRHAVPQGIIAILDGATGEPLVGFDAQGHAVLEDPPGTSPPSRPTP